MTILVTGAAGFIGSNFVLDWLDSEDENIVALDNLTYAGNLDNLSCLSKDIRYFFIKGDIFDGEIYNVLTGNHSVKDVVDHIKSHIPDVSINFVKNEIMNQLSYEVSVDKLESKGFTFNGSLERGIEETISVLRSSNS